MVTGATGFVGQRVTQLIQGARSIVGLVAKMEDVSEAPI